MKWLTVLQEERALMSSAKSTKGRKTNEVVNSITRV